MSHRYGSWRPPPDARQLPLFAGDERPACKLFLAVLPPPAVAARIDALNATVRRRFACIATPRLPHVSLHCLGDYRDVPHAAVERVQRAAGQVAVAPFETAFDRLQVFSGAKRPLVLRCGKGTHGFVALRKAVVAALAGRALPLADWHFTPHLTLFYGGGDVPETVLQRPIAWRVEAFALVLSLQGRRRYELCGRWPLEGRRESDTGTEVVRYDRAAAGTTASLHTARRDHHHER